MKKAIKWWKGLAYWKKGAIIGFFGSLILLLMGKYLFSPFAILIIFPTSLIILGLQIIFNLPLSSVGNLIGVHNEYGIEIAIVLGTIISPLFYLLLGALIGFIIGKRKNDK